jgi:lipid-binding SYLF domain-containing protein
MKNKWMAGMALALVTVFASACTTAPKTETERQDLVADADRTLDKFRNSDTGIKDHMAKAYGYAVFPTIGKGAVGVGGAYGKGVVYEGGRAIGYCDMTQGTIGLALGGQAYSELILFQDKHALERFKRNEIAFAAQASAVAAASGAGANASDKEGVMVYTMGEKGLMYEASIGGQGFSYQPM